VVELTLVCCFGTHQQAAAAAAAAAVHLLASEQPAFELATHAVFAAVAAK